MLIHAGISRLIKGTPAELFWEIIKVHLHFLLFPNTEMVQLLVVENLFVEDKDLFILYIQYHGCWCPGDTRSQGISSHGIDLILMEY